MATITHKRGDSLELECKLVKDDVAIDITNFTITSQLRATSMVALLLLKPARRLVCLQSLLLQLRLLNGRCEWLFVMFSSWRQTEIPPLLRHST